MGFEGDMEEVNDTDPEDVLYAEIAPYVADPGRIRMIIREAMISGEPADFLARMMEKSDGSLKIDLRIVLNRLDRKS